MKTSVARFSKFVFYITAIVLITFFPIFFLFDKYYHLNPEIEINLQSTVEVRTEKGMGTGVVFINDNGIFVWTCAHVVQDAIHCAVSVDLNTGQATHVCKTDDVKVAMKLFNDDNEEYGEIVVNAKIIRFSSKDDIALLEIPRNPVFSKGVKFPASHNYRAKPGVKIFHIGCMHGEFGHKSISEGIHGINGVRLEDELFYNRIGIGIQPGSSGGGVFEASSGRCIGLAARSLDRSACNQCFIIGWSRMVKFASRLDCMWALDTMHRVPSNRCSSLTDDVTLIPIHLLNKAN